MRTRSVGIACMCYDAIASDPKAGKRYWIVRSRHSHRRRIAVHRSHSKIVLGRRARDKQGHRQQSAPAHYSQLIHENLLFFLVLPLPVPLAKKTCQGRSTKNSTTITTFIFKKRDEPFSFDRFGSARRFKTSSMIQWGPQRREAHFKLWPTKGSSACAQTSL